MQRKEQRSWKSGIIFLVTLVVLGSIAWIVWSTFNHRLPLVSNPLTSQESISVGVLDAPQSLDIRSEQEPAITQALLGNVYQTLVGKNDRNAPEAAIAKSWDVSGNGLTYTFHLSDNATFSNGDELNAQDVVWSLQQTITKKFQGSDALSALSAVNELDDHSVRITLKSPSPDLLQTLSGRAGIIYDQDAKLNYSSQAIGSGPYVVSQWDKGSSLTLSRNTRYWASAPKIGDVTLRYYGNASELSKALESGDVDVATPLDAAGLQTAQNNTSLAVAKGLSQDSVVLAFNTDTSSVLSDQRLRQAIRYLVDNDDIISKQQGLGAAIGGPLSPLDAGYEDLTGLFPLDITKGSALAAYFPPSYYGGSLRLVYQDSYGEQLGQLIKAQLAKGGIPVTVTMVNDADWKQRVESQRAFDMTIITTSSATDSAQYADPSKSITRFDNPDAQNHYRLAQAATSEADHTRELQEYAKAVSQGAPADWLYMKVPVTAYSRNLKGVPTNMTTTYLPLWNISKE